MFVEIISDFPQNCEYKVEFQVFPDEHVFIIASNDPWYGDIIVYIQTQIFPSHFSSDEH